MKPDLNLPIKSQWLDRILSLEKREEYRLTTNKQLVRVFCESEGYRRNHNICIVRLPPRSVVAVLRAGYRMDSNSALVEIKEIEVRGLEYRLHPEWGEPEEPHFVLKLGAIIARGEYRKVRNELSFWNGVPPSGTDFYDGDKTCGGYGWVTGIRYLESDDAWHSTIHCNNIGYFNAIHGIGGDCDHILADRCKKCAFRTPKKRTSSPSSPCSPV